MSVSDITGQEENFTLDRHGFQLCRHEVKSRCLEDAYSDDKRIKDEYYPEMEQLLKEVYVVKLSAFVDAH